jgi:hypothetical protein
MFWRLTAQRLLVERGRPDVVPALLALARDHTTDELGLNAGALHGLWTLHGLGVMASDAAVATAMRQALHHPAASVRRAALQMLPRDGRLEADIFAAGLLPDRTSPGAVDYTVGTAILQDASAPVRLQALLALSELPASARAAAAIGDILFHAESARDPWLPDAAAIAGVKQGQLFLLGLMTRRVTATDSVAHAGMRRAMELMARHFAVAAQPEPVIALIEAVPTAHPALAVGVLNGIALGWPEERTPPLTVAQRASLAAAARGATGPVAAAFERVAARWGIPELFRAP